MSGVILFDVFTLGLATKWTKINYQTCQELQKPHLLVRQAMWFVNGTMNPGMLHCDWLKVKTKSGCRLFWLVSAESPCVSVTKCTLRAKRLQINWSVHTQLHTHYILYTHTHTPSYSTHTHTYSRMRAHMSYGISVIWSSLSLRHCMRSDAQWQGECLRGYAGDCTGRVRGIVRAVKRDRRAKARGSTMYMDWFTQGLSCKV